MRQLVSRDIDSGGSSETPNLSGAAVAEPDNLRTFSLYRLPEGKRNKGSSRRLR